jgi:excisionase family DNA binding protein
MATSNENIRLIRFLQAPPDQQAAIDLILDGKAEARRKEATGPLLFGMSEAARFLGVSRATLWRIVKAGKISKVEILPSSFRIRRVDLEAIVGNKD